MSFQIRNNHENSVVMRLDTKSFGWRLKAVLIAVVVLLVSPSAFAQTSRQPTAEKIINDYFKAAGSKKRLAAIKSAVYQWKYRRDNSPNVGQAQTRLQNPALYRFDLSEPAVSDLSTNDESAATIATNGNAVWRRDADGKLRTLSDAESKAVRLQSILAATRLVDIKRQRISAQIVGSEKVADETASVVEFSARNGARIRYFFGANSKLPIKIENPAAQTSVCLSNYRDAGNGILEAQKLTEPCAADSNANSVVFELEKVSYNAPLNQTIFDPPGTLENFDLAALLAELTENEEKLQERLSEYSFVQKVSERTFTGKGAVNKESQRVYEVFPTRGGKRVLKLISENGVPLAGEKLAGEERRASKELTDAEEEFEKEQRKRQNIPTELEQRRRSETTPAGGGLEQQAILTLLRTSDVYAPRIEFFRDREAIVVNFRPRANFKPRDFNESVFSKLAGTAWIDKEEKQIIRLETIVTENVKLGGGLLATFRKGSAIIFERTKFGEVWLPKLFQANASARFLLVAGLDASSETEYGSYNRFESEVKDYKVNEPGEQKPQN